MTLILFVLVCSVALCTLAAKVRARALGIALPVDGVLIGFVVLAVGASAIVARVAEPLSAIAAAGVLGASAVCAWSDVRCGLVFDLVTLPSLVVVGALVVRTGWPAPHLLSAACMAGLLLALHLVTRGRGLGFGDVKLAALLGLAMVPLVALEGLGLAFVSGALVCVTLIALGRLSRHAAIPFAPFLYGGSAFALAVGAMHP